MTIQWFLIASFLYAEIGFIILLLLPFIPSQLWRRIFYFRLWRSLGHKANMYFSVFLIVLILFFLDSVREMLKYSSKDHDHHHHHHDFASDLQTNVKLFRAQRNYYIVGFAIFLCLVVRRLWILILDDADLLCRNDEVMKKALEATDRLEKLNREVQSAMGSSQTKISVDKNTSEELERLRKQLNAKKNEISLLKQRIEVVKEKSSEVSLEYDELCLKVDTVKVIGKQENIGTGSLEKSGD